MTYADEKGPVDATSAVTAGAASSPAVAVESGMWVEVRGGYYADDLMAIQGGAVPDGHLYLGPSRTPGHDAVRNAAAALSVRLRSASGAAGWGDVCTPQYSGFSGRDLPIQPQLHGPQVDRAIAALAAAGSVTFERGCGILEELRLDDRPLHTGVRYGVSQALLGLVAQERGLLPAHVLAASFGTRELRRVALYAQTGEDRHRGVDKMIMKRVDVLPHGLINSPSVFGRDGSAFLEYAKWVSDRVCATDDLDYRPRLHFDIYGLLGTATDGDTSSMVDFCRRLTALCHPLAVQLESPVFGSDGDDTRQRLAELRGALRDREVPIAIVADDWCNGLDDIASFAEAGAVDIVQIKMPDLGSLTNALTAASLCRDHGVGVFIGGSCTETELSARYSAHLALVVAADQVLAKPGMGVDEGVLIVGNEMARVLADQAR